MEGLGRAFRYTASPWRKQPPVFFGMYTFLEEVNAVNMPRRHELLLTNVSFRKRGFSSEVKKNSGLHSPEFFTIDFYNIIRLVNHRVRAFYNLSAGEDTSDIDIFVQDDNICILSFL